MGIYVFIQLLLISLFGLFGWLIKNKKKYGLISGFVDRSPSEQEQLIENGYPQKVGTLFFLTAGEMLLLLPLVFTSFPFVMEVQFGFMLVFLLGGFIFLARYELPSKRKRSYMVGTVVAVIYFFHNSNFF